MGVGVGVVLPKYNLWYYQAIWQQQIAQLVTHTEFYVHVFNFCVCGVGVIYYQAVWQKQVALLVTADMLWPSELITNFRGWGFKPRLGGGFTANDYVLLISDWLFYVPVCSPLLLGKALKVFSPPLLKCHTVNILFQYIVREGSVYFCVYSNCKLWGSNLYNINK